MIIEIFYLSSKTVILSYFSYHNKIVYAKLYKILQQKKL